MRGMAEAVLLRVFLGEDDMAGDVPLWRAVIGRACEAGLAGATALPASLGFGISRDPRSGLNPEAGGRLPIVIEIVDRADRIEAFLPVLDAVIDSGLVTTEPVRACFYPSPCDERNGDRDDRAG